MQNLHWPEWKSISTQLLQISERHCLKQAPGVVLQTRLGMPGEIVDGYKLSPKFGVQEK